MRTVAPKDFMKFPEIFMGELQLSVLPLDSSFTLPRTCGSSAMLENIMSASRKKLANCQVFWLPIRLFILKAASNCGGYEELPDTEADIFARAWGKPPKHALKVGQLHQAICSWLDTSTEDTAVNYIYAGKQHGELGIPILSSTIPMQWRALMDKPLSTQCRKLRNVVIGPTFSKVVWHLRLPIRVLVHALLKQTEANRGQKENTKLDKNGKESPRKINPAPTLFCLPGGSGITRHSKTPFARYMIGNSATKKHRQTSSRQEVRKPAARVEMSGKTPFARYMIGNSATKKHRQTSSRQEVRKPAARVEMSGKVCKSQHLKFSSSRMVCTYKLAKEKKRFLTCQTNETHPMRPKSEKDLADVQLSLPLASNRQKHIETETCRVKVPENTVALPHDCPDLSSGVDHRDLGCTTFLVAQRRKCLRMTKDSSLAVTDSECEKYFKKSWSCEKIWEFQWSFCPEIGNWKLVGTDLLRGLHFSCCRTPTRTKLPNGASHHPSITHLLLPHAPMLDSIYHATDHHKLIKTDILAI
ncbi:hypothetical protein CLF_112594 [Clonorchis sinensis]|uniref:Uncharacterized protein n=1 Tax=Clonorchis sinensis TaxID=79923 RepID=G7YWM8_CLOSI|nr:hypothetical protein CLF_112594 [Clonorchis sinensis]